MYIDFAIIELKLTFDIHSFALYNNISDMRFMAILNGIMVCSVHPGDVSV